ncbi:glucose-6-phosphate isomerase [uncultured Pseudokineococcus sp.]|uniref:glucose-6-phosphate isomerase n=1 Tax=uncultured Pseudokineococcus sp. TaxID=1642928 RepID=UPI002638B797|nr:glucose-6-phosphate isomerase [uncultured Pseudokineococcus sp.]
MSGLSVTATGDAARAVSAHVTSLVADRVASRVAAQEADLWGPTAADEAGKRLGWVDVASRSADLPGRVASLREELAAEGVDRVVLCGMGGSSLAPEVITATAGVPLVVLDGTDPGQVRRALDEGLERTVVVVSSKSGGTVETDSQRRAFVEAMTAAGVDAARRVVVVTDPGSPFSQMARDEGYRALFEADPDVGGRYSALTAFGLVPAGLAGADVQQLLDEAAEALQVLAADDEGNPGLRLGAALGGTDPLRDKLVLVEDGTSLRGFGAWAEQLVAESTGKEGTGLLPVVVAGTGSPEVASPPSDALVVRLVADDADGSDAAAAAEVRTSGSLGGQMVLWETAVAVAGRLLGINPFDQPDVESAKQATRELLEGSPETEEPLAVDGDVEIRGTSEVAGAATLEEAVDALLAQLAQVDGDRGYLAVMAYLDREADADLEGVREDLATRTGRPVTFGWGPRFLHSTGQYHKGGPATGVYLQVTSEPAGEDLPIPDRPFTFGGLQRAQAAGDAAVLADHGRPVLRLHLTDRSALGRLRAVLAGADGRTR